VTRSAKRFAAAYFTACCVLISLATALPSGNGGRLAVFASPFGGSAIEVIARAGGRIVHAGSTPWIAVTEQSDPDLIARLYQSGAGFVASGAVAQACAGWTGVSGEKWK
jgi:hypothetical protein